MAAMPLGMESCRKPSVFENTSTENAGVTGDGESGGACELMPHAVRIINAVTQQVLFNLQSALPIYQFTTH